MKFYSGIYPTIHIQRVARLTFLLDDNPMPRTASGDLEVVEFPTFVETWAAMEQVLASGKAKAIGVSNFSIKQYVTWPPIGLTPGVNHKIASSDCYRLRKWCQLSIKSSMHAVYIIGAS